MQGKFNRAKDNCPIRFLSPGALYKTKAQDWEISTMQRRLCLTSRHVLKKALCYRHKIFIKDGAYRLWLRETYMKKHVRLLISIAVCLAAGLSGLSHAASEVIGHVKTLTGDAWVSTAGQEIKAKPGTPVYLGSMLKTAKGASMGVTFKDTTRMSFGPDTQMTVDEYLYAPEQGKLKLSTNFSKGTLNYVSGLIAKIQPNAVSVKTPGGTIGVRGTQFFAKVAPPAAM